MSPGGPWNEGMEAQTLLSSPPHGVTVDGTASPVSPPAPRGDSVCPARPVIE